VLESDTDGEGGVLTAILVGTATFVAGCGVAVETA